MVVLDGDDAAAVSGKADGAPSAASTAAEMVRRKSVPVVVEDDMTAIQKKRFNYFKQMRIFLTNMTKICERLR